MSMAPFLPRNLRAPEVTLCYMRYQARRRGEPRKWCCEDAHAVRGQKTPGDRRRVGAGIRARDQSAPRPGLRSGPRLRGESGRRSRGLMFRNL
ncbi:uncharacterized protein LOC116981574 isoform X3 [Amblyraja radiata]|uniref:uncharacterized protein LOC116981574 isoform X3 n=1 Tax=Amblyraja radiata TaxID=386614 RepID=UPI00140366B0|nr:uncharacterized protein LOC116981574 isoform X3 [Amblyraja radiata]